MSSTPSRDERFLADEGVDFRIVRALREAGYVVSSIQEDSPSISDAEVLARAVEEDIILVTEDKDFGDMVFLQKKSAPGILLVRLAGLSGSRKVELILEMFDRHSTELRGSFSVLTDRALRIREI
jgi:predicted nuclease of predicted toxin-antitoxin system